MTAVNAEALLDAVDHVKAHPEEWDQDEYRCGTGMCIAGHGAERAGGRWATSPLATHSACLIAEPGDDRLHVGMCGQPTHIHASRRARRVFGLTVGDAVELFWSHNTLARIEVIVYTVAGRRDDLAAVIRQVASDGRETAESANGIIDYLYFRNHGCVSETELRERWGVLRRLCVEEGELDCVAIDAAVDCLIGEALRVDEVAS